MLLELPKVNGVPTTYKLFQPTSFSHTFLFLLLLRRVWVRKNMSWTVFLLLLFLLFICQRKQIKFQYIKLVKIVLQNCTTIHTRIKWIFYYVDHPSWEHYEPKTAKFTKIRSASTESINESIFLHPRIPSSERLKQLITIIDFMIVWVK